MAMVWARAQPLMLKIPMTGAVRKTRRIRVAAVLMDSILPLVI
jgi:hypothetical protein